MFYEPNHYNSIKQKMSNAKNVLNSEYVTKLSFDLLKTHHRLV